MAELDSPAGVLPDIPDNLTLAQFILDSQHPSRPIRKHGIPWFIEDHTGRSLGYEEVRSEPLFSASALTCKVASRSTYIPISCYLDTCTSFWLSQRAKAQIWH